MSVRICVDSKGFLKIQIKQQRACYSMLAHREDKTMHSDPYTDDKARKRKDAFFLFYESVLKPDHELRQDAHEQKCFYELMEWRNEIISYLDGRRNEEF